MGIKIQFLVAILLGGGISGCANMFKYQPYARSVQKRPGAGGIVALRLDHRSEDQVKAKEIMAQTCGSLKAKIIEEGEVVIGTVTNSQAEKEAANKRQVGSLFGMPVTSGHDGQVNTTSETLQKKEWQLKYRCMSKS